MRILVGISGGIDSAYTAYKLKAEGNEVEGAVLIMHDYTELDAAREAATSVGIPLHEIDCREQFEAIKDNFAFEYASGRTPHHCIICKTVDIFGYLLGGIVFEYMSVYSESACRLAAAVISDVRQRNVFSVGAYFMAQSFAYAAATVVNKEIFKPFYAHAD